MIDRQEVLDFSGEFGLSPHVIEKDYVLGWVLAGIAQHKPINRSWVFKGGTCLKKCFFETYRFSEDLDLIFFHEFERNLPELIEHLTRACRLEDDRQKFSEIAQEFHYSTQSDGYNALYALRDMFDENSDKRKIIDFLINEQNYQNQEGIDF